VSEGVDHLAEAIERADREAETMRAALKVKFPEYERGALFKCDHGCGTFRRDRCLTFRGRLCCPACRYQGTLAFQNATEST
jgi:hypothetical protein